LIDRHPTKNREWLRLHDEFLNELVEVLIDDSSHFGTSYGWKGKLIVSAVVARPAPSRDERSSSFFKRGERWTSVFGVKFDILYTSMIDNDEVMLTSPYGSIQSALWDNMLREGKDRYR